MSRWALSVVAVPCLLVLSPVAVRATFVQWDVDATQSKVTLAIPAQAVSFPNGDGTSTSINMQVRNQSGGNTWNQGNTAFFDGLLNSEYTEGAAHTIQFLSNPIGQLPGLNSGNYRPNPAAYNPAVTDAANPDGTFANTSTSAAVFAAKIQGVIGVALDAGFFSFYNTSFNLTSNPLNVTGTTGGTFDGVGVSFGLAQSGFAIDGVTIPFVGQKIPDTLTSIDNIQGVSTAATASVTNLGGLNRRLNLTMTVPGAIDFEGTTLTMTITTTIVATGVALFPGDVDMNGVVEFSDLNTLLSNYGLPGTFTSGDFDHSGVVDFDDLNTLLTNYGLSAPVSASIAPVPEPGTLVLGALGLCAIGIAVRRQKESVRD